MKRKQEYQPTVALRPLHWSKVRPVEVADTVWRDIDDERLDLDHAELEELFQKKAASARSADKAAQSGGAKDQEVHLVDARRSYNVDIGLSRFKMARPRPL